MQLETERLLLRPLEASDLPHLQRYAVRPEFYRYIPVEQQTPESVASFLNGELERVAEENRFVMAVEPKDVGFIVGALRIEVKEAHHKDGDIGFAFDADYQRRGYATEAVMRLLTFGFEHLHLHRIWATADVENERSWRLMEKAGMQRDGLLREHILIQGRWRSSYLYSLLESD